LTDGFFFVQLKILLFILIIFNIHAVYSQKGLREKLDSLKKAIRQSTYYDSSAVFKNGQLAIKIAKKLKDPTEEALIYQYFGNFYYFSSSFEKARKYYSKSIEIASQDEKDELIVSTKIRLTFITAEKDLLAAEREFKALLNNSLKYNYTINTIEIYNGLGNIYDSRQMRDEALKYYLKGLKIAEKSKKKYHQAMLLNNIGLVKINNHQIQEAEKDFTEALQIIDGMNENRLASNLNNNLGLVNKELKDYSQSIKYYRNTVLNAKKLGFPEGKGVAFLNLSDSYLLNKEYKSADKYADSALMTLIAFQQWNYVGLAYQIKSSINRVFGKIAVSKQYVDSIFILNKKYPNPSNTMFAHQELAKIFEKEGNFKLAYFHTNRYHRLFDSISQITNKDNLAQLQVIFGKEKIETELENERNRNSLLSKENELKQTKIQIIILASFFLLIIGIGWMYVRNIRLTRKQQKDFTQKLIENIDEERSRISKDLHDDIGQSLSIIKSKINLFNSGRITNVSGLDAEVGTVIEQTRHISHFLHPSFITKLGLERSLVSLTEKTQESTGIVCSLDIKNNLENVQIENQTQIYRILQECINNTLKHANASALKISIKENQTEFIIKYQDNGIGISDKKVNREGIGLLTIRERAIKINGKIITSSSVGKGYKLQLIISK
jgi:signal transduction histidine kinase/Tfp pilus assembly protein PilF